MINFVLCDDSKDILDNLSHMLNHIFMKHDLEAKIAFKTNKGSLLLSYLNENPTDVIILDINLRSRNGWTRDCTRN